MSYLNIIAYIFGYLAALGLLFWIAITLFQASKDSRRVGKIRQAEAKIAVLRMLLKAKVKKHIGLIETQSKSDKVFLSLIETKTQEICSYDFTSTGEYELMLQGLDRLYELIEVEMQKKSPTRMKMNEDKVAAYSSHKGKTWFRVIKYGKSIALIVQDIVEASNEVRLLIENFISSGGNNKKNKFSIPEVIKITEYESFIFLIESMTTTEQEALEQGKLTADGSTT